MSRPDLRELECFLAVADHLNFSQAARHLHLSQPPLSRQVKSLEEKLGCRLFERNTHHVSLTRHGKLFLEEARAILHRIDQASETLREMPGEEVVRLRVAFVGALLDEKLVALIQRFRQAHPACQLQITDLSPASQEALLKSGELDGAFIGAKPGRTTREITFLIWQKEPLLLAAPEGHPLARLKTLRWRDLAGQGWVMVSRAAAPAFRRQFSELAERHRLSPRIVQESDRLPAILTMVAAGSGITLVPQNAGHLISRGIVFRPLPAPRPMLYHAFAYRRGHVSKSLASFLAHLQKRG